MPSLPSAAGGGTGPVGVTRNRAAEVRTGPAVAEVGAAGEAVAVVPADVVAGIGALDHGRLVHVVAGGRVAERETAHATGHGQCGTDPGQRHAAAESPAAHRRDRDVREAVGGLLRGRCVVRHLRGGASAAAEVCASAGVPVAGAGTAPGSQREPLPGVSFSSVTVLLGCGMQHHPHPAAWNRPGRILCVCCALQIHSAPWPRPR